MVVRGRTRNPSGCFAGCLHITRENVNFDVLTGFKACLNDAFSNNILTATVPSFKVDLRYTNRKFAMKYTWRCIEAVVTRTTRNRFVLNRARGFESHHLRQKSQIQTNLRLFLLHQAEKDRFCLITVCFTHER